MCALVQLCWLACILLNSDSLESEEINKCSGDGVENLLIHCKLDDGFGDTQGLN